MTYHSRFAASASTAVIAFSLIAGFTAPAAAYSVVDCIERGVRHQCRRYPDMSSARIHCVKRVADQCKSTVRSELTRPTRAPGIR